MRIAGSVAVVSGASSGIGAATALAIARRGGVVALLARNERHLERVAEQIRTSGGTARVYPVDLADTGATQQVAEQILAEMGPPDILVNNAGAGRFLFLEETRPEEAVQMMAVPYFAAFTLTRTFLPAMLRRGRGHIVNLTSPASRVPWPGAAGYAAARWAMRGFTEALRAELRSTPLRVTLVVPGKVQTAYFAHNPGTEERIPAISRLIRTLTPEEVAEAIVRAVASNPREVVLPFMLRVVYLIHGLCPPLVEWMVSATGSRRAKPEPDR